MDGCPVPRPQRPGYTCSNAPGKGADRRTNASGAREGPDVRPVGIAISPVDGALYISSDSDGYVYRVGLQR